MDKNVDQSSTVVPDAVPDRIQQQEQEEKSLQQTTEQELNSNTEERVEKVKIPVSSSQEQEQEQSKTHSLEGISYTQYEQGQNNSQGGWGWGSLKESLTKTVLQDTKQFGNTISKAFTEIVNVGQEDTQQQKKDDTRQQKKDDNDDVIDDDDDDIDFDAELQRLEGGGGGGGDNLQVGLKAIDDQVEQLADGALKALGSFWGGVSGAVKGGIRMGQQFAGEALDELKPMEKVKKAQEIGSKLMTRAEKGLEEIGKQMMADIDTQDDQDLMENQDGQQPEKEEVTFDSCFYVYGGQQFFEDLESLSNECAKSCNRSRAQMTAQQKQELESKIEKLGQIFDLDKEVSNEVGDSSVNNQALIRAYEPLAHLCKKSVEAAKEMYEKLSKEIQQQGEIQSDEDQSDNLGMIRERGVKLLSELCSAGIDRLLTLGRSINAHFRLNDKSDVSDGVTWPEDSILMASLLRGQVKQLLTDCATVGSAFIKSVTNAGKLLQLNEQAQKIASNLDLDKDNAAQKLRDGFRNLMFVVMVKEISTQQPEQTENVQDVKKDE